MCDSVLVPNVWTILAKSIQLADSFLVCLYSREENGILNLKLCIFTSFHPLGWVWNIIPGNCVSCRLLSTYIYTFSQILGRIKKYCENLFLSVEGRVKASQGESLGVKVNQGEGPSLSYISSPTTYRTWTFGLLKI